MLPAIQTFQNRFGGLRYFLAPMAGITDVVFRMLMRERGAEAVISELVSSEGLVRGGLKTRDLLTYDERERPLGIQIFGHSVMSMSIAARIVEDIGADFVDINLGCPVKKIICDGGGSAWLKNPIELGKLLSEIKKQITIPLTIKIRTGWDENSRNAMEVVRVAADNGVSWVAIHGRTRAQGYSGTSDWELIKQVAQNSPIPIIGNGDLLTAEQAKHKITNGYAHAIMIGRGALKNPWIFKEIQSAAPVEKNFIDFVNRHFDLAIEKKDRHRAFLSIKKFLAWYATGFPSASVFRRRVFETRDGEELRALAIDYFSSLDPKLWQNDSSPFLMGGHG